MATPNQEHQTRQAQPAIEIPRLTLNLWPDVGRALGIGRNATFQAAKSGQIPTIRIGKRLLVPRAAFDALLNGATTTAA